MFRCSVVAVLNSVQSAERALRFIQSENAVLTDWQGESNIVNLSIVSDEFDALFAAKCNFCGIADEHLIGWINGVSLPKRVRTMKSGS